MFTGALQATVIAVVGILVTAGLFLLALQRLLGGDPVVPSEADLDLAEVLGAAGGGSR